LSQLHSARAVGEFPEDIEVAVVPGRLLGQVEQDPAQREWLSSPTQVTPGRVSERRRIARLKHRRSTLGPWTCDGCRWGASWCTWLPPTPRPFSRSNPGTRPRSVSRDGSGRRSQRCASVTTATCTATCVRGQCCPPGVPRCVSVPWCWCP